MAAQNVCSFNKFGFCKFREVCRKQHNNEICDKPSCDWTTCNFIHPKICRYRRDYNYCKFGEFCKLKHIEKEYNLVQKDALIDKLTKQMESMEIRISSLE